MWSYYKLPHLDKIVRISHDENNDYYVIDLIDFVFKNKELAKFIDAPDAHREIILKLSRKYCEELNEMLKSHNS